MKKSKNMIEKQTPFLLKKCPCGQKGCNKFYLPQIQGSDGRLDEDDGRLLSYAGVGLEVAINAYASILRLPRKERLDRQFTLASLRDYIAGATGRSAEDVQNEFEAKNPIAHDDQVRLQIHIPARRQGKTALAKLQKELQGTGWNVEGESGCYEVWNEKLTPGLTLECPTIADVRGEIEAYNARAKS